MSCAVVDWMSFFAGAGAAWVGGWVAYIGWPWASNHWKRYRTTKAAAGKPEVVNEKFGHPIAPIAWLDDQLAKTETPLPAGYAWEFVVADRIYTLEEDGREGVGTILTVNLIGWNDGARGVEASFEVDLVWKAPRLLWSTYYRSNERQDSEYLERNDMLRPIIQWAEGETEKIIYRETIEKPVLKPAGYYMRSGK